MPNSKPSQESSEYLRLMPSYESKSRVTHPFLLPFSELRESLRSMPLTCLPTPMAPFLPCELPTLISHPPCSITSCHLRTLIPSVPNQQVACVKLIQDDGASVSYVANITKSTDPKTGLVTFTYIENGIVNQANNNYVDSCNGYKPTLFCNSKTYNYQCQMVFAVGTTGR